MLSLSRPLADNLKHSGAFSRHISSHQRPGWRTLYTLTRLLCWHLVFRTGLEYGTTRPGSCPLTENCRVPWTWNYTQDLASFSPPGTSVRSFPAANHHPVQTHSGALDKCFRGFHQVSMLMTWNPRVAACPLVQLLLAPAVVSSWDSTPSRNGGSIAVDACIRDQAYN